MAVAWWFVFSRNLDCWSGPCPVLFSVLFVSFLAGRDSFEVTGGGFSEQHFF